MLCMFMSNAPTTLRALRKQRGLTQVQLGRLAGCSGELISALERGTVTDTKGRILNGLSRALNVTRDDIESAIERSVVSAA